MDYDDYKRMSVFGCTMRRTPSCKGNVCYMREWGTRILRPKVKCIHFPEL